MGILPILLDVPFLTTMPFSKQANMFPHLFLLVVASSISQVLNQKCEILLPIPNFVNFPFFFFYAFKLLKDKIAFQDNWARASLLQGKVGRFESHKTKVKPCIKRQFRWSVPPMQVRQHLSLFDEQACPMKVTAWGRKGSLSLASETLPCCQTGFIGRWASRNWPSWGCRWQLNSKLTIFSVASQAVCTPGKVVIHRFKQVLKCKTPQKTKSMEEIAFD